MHWPHPPDLSMIMGRLLERSDATLHHICRIDRRLELGDARMTELAKSIEAIEAAQSKAAIGSVERWSKDLARYLVPLGVLWATGSIETALQISGALK